MAQDGGIDIIFGKTRGVLGHTERFEPVRNRLHRAPVACDFGSVARRVCPTLCKIERRFLKGFLAIADEVIE